jgi:hypothetical protein
MYIKAENLSLDIPELGLDLFNSNSGAIQVTQYFTIQVTQYLICYSLSTWLLLGQFRAPTESGLEL